MEVTIEPADAPLPWKWVQRNTVDALHDKQLAEHGGTPGVKDDNLVESAMARPQQLFAYGDPPPDAYDLAAAYGAGIARNHGFNDANKRTGWITARLFLLDNGYFLEYDKFEALEVMVNVTTGVMSEPEFATWLRQRGTSLGQATLTRIK